MNTQQLTLPLEEGKKNLKLQNQTHLSWSKIKQELVIKKSHTQLQNEYKKI